MNTIRRAVIHRPPEMPQVGEPPLPAQQPPLPLAEYEAGGAAAATGRTKELFSRFEKNFIRWGISRQSVSKT
jgi:hypothetical protein